MQTFLEETIDDLLQKHEDVSQLIIVLPSKRAGGFFKNYLRKQLKRTSFLPQIISIEEFVEAISDITIVDPAHLLLRSYQAYLKTDSIKEKEDFESFSTWIQTLLNDFNEIDRYLVDRKRFFDYLGSIKSLEKWSMQNETTDLIKAYLSFWNSLPDFYDNLKTDLLSDNLGYQGMVYRKAAEEVEHYLASKGEEPHIFIGFNALNLAEQTIFKELLETGNSSIYWDAESHFFSGEIHSASQFLRSYFEEWNYYSNKKPQFGDNYTKEKKFTFIETQKNIAQAKYAGQLLSSMTAEELSNTAVVLADESLLTPLLYSLPLNIGEVNVTMGLSIENSPLSLFFSSLFHMQQTQGERLYYKDVFRILNNPIGRKLLPAAKEITKAISEQNYTYVSVEQLIEFGNSEDIKNLQLIFGSWQDDPQVAFNRSITLLVKLKSLLKDDPLELVSAFKLYKVIEAIKDQIQSYPYIKNLKSVYALFQESVRKQTADIAGDAYQGLQIMGVLETRVLDFKNVILLSANEGVLPAGKSNASFVTYDLKKEFGLPLFTDKDAIYTYHFYHLLHRAENVFLLYNSTSEGLNAGEKSRFLMQLEKERLPNHQIEQIVVTLPISITDSPLQEISKTTKVMDRIKAIAESGISPSALTSYIRNPFEFYLSRVLKIRETEVVEETVDYNTLGTIVHNSLQLLYEPFVGKNLDLEKLSDLHELVDEEVSRQFKIVYRKGDYSTGKNLLIFEVAKRYVHNLIDLDINELRAGHQIRILQIETKMKIPLAIESIPFPVNIQGMVDRVDERDGVMRIIDYKTGMVAQGDLQIMDWANLAEDYKYSKAFQVLMYAYIIHSESDVSSSEAGILSFKNLSNGFLKFGTKTSVRGLSNSVVSEDILTEFELILKKVICEICDPDIPFVEKEV
ncbi:PD-(D/E)XK nuclease family protein [Aureitalea sp. L0-47]|uniref:PD-(D/E)XK nuclease family protein n=1 Tax=Aureitalea sp. L0-47 TaxID=2816962 RepID=UPI0022371181|nr:PD-(D/E)XK nuclease family protein [Aureitalea sp. L0-47]MCW5519861.1 PD-(D/E)XK nuclease family protein [Aureitalea sp. L0-47]